MDLLDEIDQFNVNDLNNPRIRNKPLRMMTMMRTRWKPKRRQAQGEDDAEVKASKNQEDQDKLRS